MTSQVQAPTRRAAGYKVKLLNEDQCRKCDDLWVLAFGPGWARDHAFKENTRTYGAFHGEDIHAVAGVVDYKMTFGDHVVDCGGISAVATVPGQRYQSLITVLLSEALQELHQRNVPFSSLYPFSYPFYGRMGWAATHWQYRIETTIQWLKEVSKHGNARHFHMLPKTRSQEILPVYERWVRKFNLNLSRNARKFDILMTWPDRDWQIFLHNDGYLLFDLKNSDRQKGILLVAEFVYNTEQAFLDGLALLAQMDSQFESVKWIDSNPETFLKLGIPQPRPTIHRDAGMMTRVVNEKAFAKLLPKGTAAMSLNDPLEISGNNKDGVGVGEIVQQVTGFWNQPDKRFPELYKLVAERPAYVIERY